MPSSIAISDTVSMPRPTRPPVALIAGPTASGKSAVALALAKAADGVVINADASQVYADLAVLSARPAPEEAARAPHRLFGYIDGAQACSAAAWAADARSEIGAAHASGRLPILVGGTGLYLRTLMDGIAPVPDIDTDVRERVRALSVSAAYSALTGEDPAAAARLNPADTTRVARALEVVRSTGRTLADWQSQPTGGISDDIHLFPLILLPPRDWLVARCDARFQAMLEQGAIEEVERLRSREIDPHLPVMRAIGVPEICDWLDGLTDRATMIERAQMATRRYAKRQYTWFNNQPPAKWPKWTSPVNDINEVNLVIKFLQNMLT
jgi:tRNA dimethylallyltransferase